MSSPVASSVLTSLVSFMTRPLALAQYPLTIITTLQSVLRTQLAPTFSGDNLNTFSFILSPFSIPPIPLYAAAMAAGISWDEWINLMGAGKDITFFVSPTYLRVQVGAQEGLGAITLWVRPVDDDEALVSRTIPSISQYKKRLSLSAQLLTSVRARRSSQSPSIIQIPSLLRQSSSSPPIIEETIVEQTITEDIASCEVSSDSESDSSSSIFDSNSDPDSATTSPSSSVVDLPYVPPTAKYMPPKFGSSQLCRRGCRLVSTSKPELTKYLYHGGSTNVIGGGVMLGGAKKAGTPPLAPSSPSKPTKAKKSDRSNWRKTVLIAPEDNWRSRA